MGKEITLFAIRNNEKQWFRKIGYAGFGKSWTDEFTQARIYTKLENHIVIARFQPNRQGWKMAKKCARIL